jgi:hypothetical protein
MGGERRKENGPCGGAGLHSEERKEEGAGTVGLGCKGKKRRKRKRESGHWLTSGLLGDSSQRLYAIS